MGLSFRMDTNGNIASNRLIGTPTKNELSWGVSALTKARILNSHCLKEWVTLISNITEPRLLQFHRGINTQVLGMPPEFEMFSKFAQDRLGATAFRTETGDPKAHLFYTSLLNAEAQFKWSNDSVDAEGQPFKLTSGFLDIYSPNALADYFNEQHFVGMHTALFAAVSEFSMFCFCQQEFFADIGDPSQEHSPKPWDERVPGLWLLDYTKHGGSVADLHAKTLTPRDSDRYEMAIYLSLIMARFVWLHEFSHCYNGHVRYVQDHGLGLRLYEVEDQMAVMEYSSRKADAPTDELKTTLKCLEFDADQSAFWGSCNIAIGDLETIEGIARLSAPFRIRLTMFGAYAMVWLFDQFQTYLNVKNARTHPEPSLRLQNLFRTAVKNVLPLDPSISSLHDDALNQFDAVKTAIPTMYGTEALKDAIRDRGLLDQLAKFDTPLKALHKGLEPFQYGQPR